VTGPASRPRIGITVDVDSDSYRSRFPYAEMVRSVGATPLLLPCEMESIPDYLELCDAFVMTGGDDPDMTGFGIENHPAITVISPRRQAFEHSLLEHLDATEHPLLAICLGMQLMSLDAGGTLDQHLPDTLPTADAHWNGTTHPIEGPLGCGEVHSHHRQAITDSGRLEVVARAPDGVIEAVRDPDRHHRLGVQWHPERSDDPALGIDLFRQLIRATA
jgi:putative glutamine amidotransferase